MTRIPKQDVRRNFIQIIEAMSCRLAEQAIGIEHFYAGISFTDRPAYSLASDDDLARRDRHVLRLIRDQE